MSALLELVPPEPTSVLEFENLFFGDHDALIALSRARYTFTRRVREIRTGALTEWVQALDDIRAYYELWIVHWKTRVLRVGTLARARLPLSFTWRVDVFGAPDTHTDSSPLFETACVSLVLVAAYQRAGSNLINRQDEYSEQACNVLKQCSNYITAYFTPRYSVRESFVFAPSLYKALHAAIHAQRTCRAALLVWVKQKKCLSMSVSFFRGARSFHDANLAFPSASQFDNAHVRAKAVAYKYLAQHLIDETTWQGVGIACAREANTFDGATNKSISAYYESVVKRNESEFGFKIVPTHVKIKFEETTNIQISVADETASIIMPNTGSASAEIV